MYPNDFRYTKEHEWVKVEGDEAVVGITDFAQHQLGDIIFVELPAVGQDARRPRQSIGVVESVKSVSDVYAPGPAEVVRPSTTRWPRRADLINKDPHGKGWIVRIKIADKKDLEALLDGRPTTRNSWRASSTEAASRPTRGIP